MSTGVSFRRCSFGRKEIADTQTDLRLPWVPAFENKQELGEGEKMGEFNTSRHLTSKRWMAKERIVGSREENLEPMQKPRKTPFLATVHLGLIYLPPLCLPGSWNQNTESGEERNTPPLRVCLLFGAKGGGGRVVISQGVGTPFPPPSLPGENKSG